MLLPVILLLPMVLATERVLRIDNYIVKIDDDILKSVEATDQSSHSLHLSNLNLRHVNENAFPNLPNLEYLHLSDNELSTISFSFAGLNNLKQLNVSSNLLENIPRGSLLGLTNSTDIFVRNNPLLTISTGIFVDPPTETTTPRQPSAEEMHARVGFKYNPAIHGPSSRTSQKPENVVVKEAPPTASPEPKAKLCVEGKKAKSLDALTRNEALPPNCRPITVDVMQKLDLAGQGITEFESGWYRLQEIPISEINLDDNNIAAVTAELLNDLPSSVTKVSLKRNIISRLDNGIMDNGNLRDLDLSNNVIREIDDGAFEKTNLIKSLILNGNLLNSTKFATTLPANLTILQAQDNEIAEITGNSFSRLRKLNTLKLDGNKIGVITRQSLAGLAALKFLTLTNNGLRNLEANAFQDVYFLRLLDLTNNSITNIDKDLFSGIEILLTLKIGGNKISKINRESLSGLHYTIHWLDFDNNEIERLSSDSFVNVPILELSLNGNRITKIERGSFSLPHLRLLSLNDNRLGDLDGNSFEGLGGVSKLRLAGNGITRIRKGAFKNLNGLRDVDLSNNPITRLENGALYGLQKTGERVIRVANTPLEVIQGGVFDDV